MYAIIYIQPVLIISRYVGIGKSRLLRIKVQGIKGPADFMKGGYLSGHQIFINQLLSQGYL